MKKLTSTEEDIMQIIWRLNRCFVKDIIAELTEPKPPYNTVSSVVRLLEKKGFVAHKEYGKTYEYYPIIDKEQYGKTLFSDFLSTYFNGSFTRLVSFFANNNTVDRQELEQLLRDMDDSQ